MPTRCAHRRGMHGTQLGGYFYHNYERRVAAWSIDVSMAKGARWSLRGFLSNMTALSAANSDKIYSAEGGRQRSYVGPIPDSTAKSLFYACASLNL